MFARELGFAGVEVRGTGGTYEVEGAVDFVELGAEDGGKEVGHFDGLVRGQGLGG